MAFFAVNVNTIVIIVACAAVGIGLIAFIVNIIVMAKRRKNAPAVGKMPEETEFDVTADEVLEEMETRGDYLVMSRHVIYSAGVEGQIYPGKYVFKSAAAGENSFNIRLNGLVKEYHDGDTVYLAEGDTVCPVSGSVLIKIHE